MLLSSRVGATTYDGIDFPQGIASFADAVILYDPDFGGGPAPTASRFNDPNRALGPPDYTGGQDGDGAVALGKGGRLELLFGDLILVNSGDAQPDLALFEVGPSAERVFIGLRAKANSPTRVALGTLCHDAVPVNDGYCDIGAFPGATMPIDIDAIFPGFAPGALRFDAVQLIDDPNEGNHTGSAPGADIDAVGAIYTGATACGDGKVEGFEECDDGALAPGDGCNSSCRLESCWGCSGEPSVCFRLDDGSPCEDGNACTQTDTCQARVCTGSNPVTCTASDQCHDAGVCDPGTGICSNPEKSNGTACDDGSTCSINDTCSGGACVGDAVIATGCRQSPFDQVVLKDRNPDLGDLFSWRWKKGDATEMTDFGDPVGGSSEYEVCVFEHKAGTYRLALGAIVPPRGNCGAVPCWKQLGDRGFSYRNQTPGNGIRKVLLKAGPSGKAAVTVKGSGKPLPMPGLPLSTPVKVQLKTLNTCWEADYNVPLVSTASTFKARQ